MCMHAYDAYIQYTVHTHTHTYIQTDRQTDRQTDIQSVSQTDRQTDRQTYIQVDKSNEHKQNVKHLEQRELDPNKSFLVARKPATGSEEKGQGGCTELRSCAPSFVCV